jgi:hypothetical protein
VTSKDVPIHDRWFWPILLRDLDRAGLAVVQKPALKGKGLSAAKKAQQEKRTA